MIKIPEWDEEPNEWRYRLDDPNKFDKDTYAQTDIATGIRLVVAKYKGASGPKDPTHEQSLRFAKAVFPSITQAKAWYNAHWKNRR